MQLETDRLILRRWHADDVEPLARILLHPEVAPWIGATAATADDVAAAIARYDAHFEAHGFGRLAVVSRATGRLLGRAGAMREAEWTASRCQDEIGWAIDRRHWGAGYATEAATSAIADVFDRCGLREVIVFTRVGNHASRRVMEKCGFDLRGTTDWNGALHAWYALAAAGRPQRRDG